MKNSKVFLVEGIVSYEGQYSLAVFSNMRKAQSFVEKCKKHAKQEPQMPAPDEGIKEWGEYHQAQKDWLESKPAGNGFAYYDEYNIKEMEIQ